MPRHIEFVNNIVNGKYDVALGMMTNDEMGKWTKEKLADIYNNMLSYGTGIVNNIEEIKIPGAEDGWFYVAVSGDDFNEAISGVVSNDMISDVVFGRP